MNKTGLHPWIYFLLEHSRSLFLKICNHISPYGILWSLKNIAVASCHRELQDKPCGITAGILGRGWMCTLGRPIIFLCSASALQPGQAWNHTHPPSPTGNLKYAWKRGRMNRECDHPTADCGLDSRDAHIGPNGLIHLLIRRWTRSAGKVYWETHSRYIWSCLKTHNK